MGVGYVAKERVRFDKYECLLFKLIVKRLLWDTSGLQGPLLNIDCCCSSPITIADNNAETWCQQW